MDVDYRTDLEMASPPPTLAFVRQVASVYHQNAWLFLKILLPAALFGWLVLTVSYQQAVEIQRHLPHGPEILHHQRELSEMWLFRWSGFAIDWLLYCFVFAAICVAVDKLERGKPVLAEDCFRPVRDRMASFLRLSGVLFLLVPICVIAAIDVSVALLSASPQTFRHMSRDQIYIASMLAFALPFWPASRFGLAIPGLVLGAKSVFQSLEQSWRVTRGCWAILGLLLLESMGGSYLGYMLPQWAWRIAYQHGVRSMPLWWAESAAGFVLGVLLQPHMLVGFGLLYVRRVPDTE